jgi:hypothetical protein
MMSARQALRRLFSCWVLIYAGVLLVCLLWADIRCAQAQVPDTLPAERADTRQEQQPSDQQKATEKPPRSPRTPLPDLERWLNRDLVGTIPRGKLGFGIGPRFVDFAGNSLVAVKLRLKYGITDTWMSSIRLRFYTENPFPTETRAEAGLGDVLFETKYRLPAWRAQHLEAAVNLKVLVPLSDDVNRSNEVVHVIPGISLLRPLLRWPPLHVYSQLSMNIATGEVTRPLVLDEIQESLFLLALGLVYPTPSVFFFFDVEWQTTTIVLTEARHNVLVTPGVRIELPKISWLPGLWNVDVGFRVGSVDALFYYDIGLRLTIDADKRKQSRTGRVPVPSRSRLPFAFRR